MKQNFNKNPLELYHADTQEWYIDNPDVICHVGKKGMKWGFIDGIATGGRKAIGKLTATGEYVYDNAKNFGKNFKSGLKASKESDYHDLSGGTGKYRVKATKNIGDDIGFYSGRIGKRLKNIGSTVKSGVTKGIPNIIKRAKEDWNYGVRESAKKSYGDLSGATGKEAVKRRKGIIDDIGYAYGRRFTKKGKKRASADKRNKKIIDGAKRLIGIY